VTTGRGQAAGFQLWEQSASGLGNAYAGSAAVAENASTLFYNPAGMTYLPVRQHSGGLNAIGASFDFTDRSSTLPPAFGKGPAGGRADDGGTWGFVPNLYVSWPFSRTLVAGLGVGAPFGLKTLYGTDWIGRYHATRFDVQTLNLNPSIAYRIDDHWSVGAGFSWQRMRVDYRRQAIPAGAQAQFLAYDQSWGWNVGVLYQWSPTLRLGASYRSEVDHGLDGRLAAPLAYPDSNALLAVPARSRVTLPGTVIISAAWQLNECWEVLGDFSWTGWSKLQRSVIRAGGRPLDVLELGWEDSYRVALGANYRLASAWTLRAGLAWDQAPVHDGARRLVSLPDSDRYWLSVGTRWKPKAGATLDLGYTHVFLDDPSIHKDGGPGKGTIAGGYEATVDIFGIQYSQEF